MKQLALVLALIASGCAAPGARRESAPIDYRLRPGAAQASSVGGHQAAGASQPVAASANTGSRTAAGPAGDRTITVRPGDTLYSISEEHQVALRALIDTNALQPPFELSAGQTLAIPPANQITVRRGDTLFSIAQRFRVDLRSLGVMNGLDAPYTLEVGDTVYLPALAVDWGARAQPLEMAQAPVAAPSPAPREGPVTGTGRTSSAPQPEASVQAPAPVQPRTPRPQTPEVQGPAPPFAWPHGGRIIGEFGQTGTSKRNDGVNIAAVEGDPVRAAADGVVMYAGAELKGYGQLVLVKHADGWVSAYAHNRTITVQEGARVRQGEQIATAGSTGAVETPQLHFELRRGGRPADPIALLPSR